MDSYGLASVGMYGSVFDRNFLSFLSSSWFRSLPGHSLVGVQLEDDLEVKYYFYRVFSVAIAT